MSESEYLAIRVLIYDKDAAIKAVLHQDPFNDTPIIKGFVSSSVFFEPEFNARVFIQ